MSAIARAIAVALLVAACSAPPAASPTAPAPTPTATAASAVTVHGVAGLVPRNFPRHTAADFEDLFRSVPETGGALGVYTNWADDAASEGKVPRAVASTFAAAAQYGFTPVVALGVARDAPGGGVTPTVDWASAQRARFMEAVTAVAREHRPELLALGVEVNRHWMSDPASFDGFVAAFAEAYDAVKAVSPGTRVFTVFQLELLRGTAYLMTAQERTAEQWDLLSRFPKADLIGLTTYPFLAYRTPAEIPDDYYASVADRVTVPLAFTEVGWPSGDLAGSAEWGGTPEEQAEFVRRFDALAAPERPALAMWSFPHEYGTAGPPTFATIGLRLTDGTPKPALGEWRRIAARR